MSLSISRRFIAGAVAVVLWMAGALFAASQVGAGTAQLNVSPTTVTPGQTIMVSQSCRMISVDVGVFEGWLGEYVSPSTTPIVEQTGITPDAGDQWQVELTIPEDASPGSYTVHAECSDGEPKGESYPYANVELTILPAPTSSTTTTVAAATTMAPTTTAPTAPAAQAAAAVTAQPSYTG